MIRVQTIGSEDMDYVFCAYITLKNGRRIYAREYGLKTFRIPVRKRSQFFLADVAIASAFFDSSPRTMLFLRFHVCGFSDVIRSAVLYDLIQPTSFPGGVDMKDALDQTGCQGRQPTLGGTQYP